MTVSLELAITAIRAKRRDEGRRMLNILIQQNPNDEAAWLWMSEVVENDDQRVKCLQNVLTINPKSKQAHMGLQRLGQSANNKLDTKPVAAKVMPQPQPADGALDPKTITKELPFTPLKEPFPTMTQGENGDAMEVARKRELSDTKTRLHQLTAALAAKQALRKQHDSEPVAPQSNGADSQPVHVPLPDFLSALDQINQPSFPMMGHAPQQTPIIATVGKGYSQPYRPDSVPFSPSMGYISPSHPTRPVSLNQMGLHPSQVASHSMMQFNQPAYPYAHASTIAMPMYERPSTAIPVIQANSTIGAMAGYAPAHHGNTTMGMPIPMPQQMDSTAYLPVQNGHKTDQQLIADWQEKHGYLYDEEDEDEEDVNIVMVFVFGFLTITALGGFGILALLLVTGY